MKNDIDYLNVLYPNTFIKVNSPCPLKLVSVRPSKETWEMLFKAAELGYKTQFLPNNKIGIWK